MARLERSSAVPCKAIVVSGGPGEALRAHVSGLAGLRRALCLPLAPGAPDALPSFTELWGDEAELRGEVARWPLAARAWLVAEHVTVDYERTWPSGTPSPGVRFVSALFRRPGSSRREFEAHWLGPHARIARSYSVPAWRYSQDVVVEALRGGGDEDGFVGMHFRTAQQLESRWADHPEEARRGAEDAALFLDLGRSVGLHARETVWDRGAS